VTAAQRPAELFVGVDVGTTATKASVVSATGEELAGAKLPTPWRWVPSGAEADPAALLAGVLAVMGQALSGAPPGRVVGVGVTSVAETLVLLGADGLPVAPSIAWHDNRSRAEVDDLRASFGDGPFGALTGLSEPSVCSLAKLAWYFRHHRRPDDPRPARRALSIADWLVYSLGGHQAFEASLASRTGALVLSSRCWWEEGLAWAGAPADILPPVVQAGAAAGRLSLAALARAPGTSRAQLSPLEALEGAALTSAGHDHLCVCAGLVATGEDQVLGSCGTAEGFVRTVAPMDAAVVSRVVGTGLNASWHTVPGKYALLVGQSLGLLLERVLALVGAQGTAAMVALDAAAEGVPPGALRIAQEGTYGNISVLGVDGSASPAALWSAALEHASTGAAHILRSMEEISGPAAELVLTGGWANCRGLRQRRQDLLPRTRWPAVTEAGARGAALFGGCAAGAFAGPADFPVPPDRDLR
jgi:sugar (pentulose or hexulose) kinase